MKQLNLKHDFPILDQKINGKPLVYLDSAATTQKPQVVIDTIVEYYKSFVQTLFLILRVHQYSKD